MLSSSVTQDGNSVALPSALPPFALLPAKKTLSRSLDPETDQPCPALGALHPQGKAALGFYLLFRPQGCEGWVLSDPA